VIKEKQEAKEEYIKEKNKGNTVAFAEINDDAKDIIKVNIGNLPADCELQIKFTYLQILKVCMNKFWRFTLPSTITPRYVR